MNKNVTQERMDKDENQRVTDVILDSARHAYDDPLQDDDDDGVRTQTSQNETSYCYAETQRKVITKKYGFSGMCVTLRPKRGRGGMQYLKQIFVTEFYRK